MEPLGVATAAKGGADVMSLAAPHPSSVSDPPAGTPVLDVSSLPDSAFDWRDLPAAGGLEWLGATPKSKESAFTEIRLGFDDKGLVALEVHDNFGQRTLIRLAKLERNPKLPAELFRFTPPAGADVVGD